MTPRTDLAVVVPTRDRADNLHLLFESLAQQEFVDFQVVVVDDGSTDGTSDLLRRLAGECFWRDRLISVDVPTGTSGNRARARNIGIAALPPEVDRVAMLDSDLILPPDALTQLDAASRSARDSIVLGEVRWLPDVPRGALLATVRSGRFDVLRGYTDLLRPIRMGGTYVGPDLRGVSFVEAQRLERPVSMRGEWGLVLHACFPRSVLRQLGGFDESFVGYGYEDLDLGVRAQNAGLTALVTQASWSLHVWHRRDWERESAEMQINLDRMIRRYGMLPFLLRQIDWNAAIHYSAERGGRLEYEAGQPWMVSADGRHRIPAR